MAMSVPHTSLSMVAGTPATLTPSSASLKPPVRLPFPPMTTSPSTSASASLPAALLCPSGVANSAERSVPSTVPPRWMMPPSLRVYRVDPALQKPPVPGPYPHDFPTPEEGRPRHRPYRRVHPRRIAPTGQNPYPQEKPPLALSTSYYAVTRHSRSSSQSTLIYRKGVIKYERNKLRFRRYGSP